MVQCVALISGGLDSQLAARLMLAQGIRVRGLHMTTPFVDATSRARRVADALHIALSEVALGEEFLALVRTPRFGYGKAANPCLDCRTRMFRTAAELMTQCGAEFVVTGEVVGQQAASQRRRDLEAIAHHSGLRDRLLRPLSAKILAETLPERAGWVKREQLHGFFGRGRRGLLELARALAVREIPAPSSGCPLSEHPFARKTHDLLRYLPEASAWQFALLKTGRHFRFDASCKVIVGRNEADNQQLEAQFAARGNEAATRLTPRGFVGPVALLIGPASPAAVDFAVGLVHRFSKQPISATGVLEVVDEVLRAARPPRPHAAADAAPNLADS
jgi:hypothetical protein